MFLPALALLLLTQSQAAPRPARPILSEATGGLKSEVHDRRGAPVEGVRISLRSATGPSWYATTDGNGRFQAGDLPPGAYRLELAKGKQIAIYSKILIRAKTWLLGVAPEEAAPGKAGPLPLVLVGPATYEVPAGVSIRPRIEKIPMH